MEGLDGACSDGKVDKEFKRGERRARQVLLRHPMMQNWLWRSVTSPHRIFVFVFLLPTYDNCAFLQWTNLLDVLPDDHSCAATDSFCFVDLVWDITTWHPVVASTSSEQLANHKEVSGFHVKDESHKPPPTDAKSNPFFSKSPKFSKPLKSPINLTKVITQWFMIASHKSVFKLEHKYRFFFSFFFLQGYFFHLDECTWFWTGV